METAARNRKKNRNPNSSSSSPTESDSSVTNVKDSNDLIGFRFFYDKFPFTLHRSYFLSRFYILRLVGFIYFIAFLSASQQIIPLLGDKGLHPANYYLSRVSQSLETDFVSRYLQLPTLFWLDCSDSTLQITTYVGLFLSFLVMTGLACNMIILFALWILYSSIVNVGQIFYSYGWESQLMETGFLSIWLVPFININENRIKPPFFILLLFRLLIVRIMLGAGMIKIRGDQCWRDLTCLDYHYETQPIPNIVSWYLHQAPHSFQAFGVAVNHFVELIVPIFCLIPIRLIQNLTGVCFVLFQILLIISGNLSFLNWLTIVPALACIDDGFYNYLTPRWLKHLYFGHKLTKQQQQPPTITTKVDDDHQVKAPRNKNRINLRVSLKYFRKVVTILVVLALLYLSIAPFQNIFSTGQIMNTSFDRFRLVNTYGAFGHVGKERHEVILFGTDDKIITKNTNWTEYQFKCKPGDEYRTPCLVAPYHLRIDWQVWFSAFQNINQNPWLIHFVYKLLINDPVTGTLIEESRFLKEGIKPVWVKANLYQYQFTNWTSSTSSDSNNVVESEKKGQRWWKRRYVGVYLPAMSLNSKELLNYVYNTWPWEAS